MARKKLNVTIDAEGRDHGKVYVLTEMSAAQAESWAARAILALMAGGVDIPEGFERFGMSGIAELGIKALARLKWEEARPLLDEMMDQAQIMPNPNNPGTVRALDENAQDIEEIATRVKIRMELWKLHVGFSQADVKPKSGTSPAAAAKR